MLQKAAETHGLTFWVGHELEFYLLRPGIADELSGGLPEPVDASVYSQTSAFDAVSSLLDDLCDSLETLGTNVEQMHAESGPGQFEVSLAPVTGECLPSAIIRQSPRDTSSLPPCIRMTSQKEECLQGKYCSATPQYHILISLSQRALNTIYMSCYCRRRSCASRCVVSGGMPEGTCWKLKLTGFE